MNNTHKQELVRQYIKDQSQFTEENITDELLTEGRVHMHRKELTPVHQDDEEVEDFKNQVRMWIKIDNEVKLISSKIKLLDNERKQRKKMLELLSAKMLRFMSSNSIDELNTREGILKYKKSMVKSSLTQKELINKLQMEFANVQNADEKIFKVFKDRQKIEKVKLLRS
jgi:hypothetical protein